MILRASLLLSVVFISGFSQSQEPRKQGESVAGTKVSLKPPDRFKPSRQFPGYELESYGSSIMITELPVPFEELSAVFSNQSELMKRGMALLNRQEARVDGHNGLLVHVKQNASGKEYLKWLLIFRADKETIMIVATFPKELERELSQKLKDSILTAKWNRKKEVAPTEGLNFTIDEKGQLKLARRMANMLMFSKSGILPSKDLDDPVFIIGQSISRVEIVNREEFATARVFETEKIGDFKIEQSTKVTIDNLVGQEIVAKGKDKASGLPMVIYQVILFEDQNYFLIQAFISDRNRQPHLEVFREISRTFKRKK